MITPLNMCNNKINATKNIILWNFHQYCIIIRSSYSNDEFDWCSYTLSLRIEYKTKLLHKYKEATKNGI